jgi:signal transduction histidine kinase
MDMRYLSFFLVFMFNLPLLAQNNEIDSLRSLLSKPMPDTAYILLMNELSRANGRFDPAKSIEYANKMIDTSVQINYQNGIGTGYLRLAQAYLIIGDYKLTLEYLLKAMDIFDKIGDSFGKARTVIDMGYFYLETEHYDQALKNYQEAYSLYHSLSSEIDQSESLNGVGLSYFKLKKYQDALDYYYKSLAIVEKMHYQFGIAAVSFNIGKVYRRMNMPDKALFFYNKTLDFGEKVIGTGNLSSYLNELGSFYITQKDYVSAGFALHKAGSMAKAINARQDIIDNYLYLSLLEESQGNFDKALSYFKNYSQLKDSLLNDNKERQINQLLVIYQTDKNKREIEFLKLQQQATEASQGRQRNFRNSLVIGICLSVIIAFLLYYRYKEKAALNKNLQELVDQRTKELVEAKEKAERSDKLKTEFLSNMSHEIRTPMNAIVGFSNLIADPALKDELREIYTRIIIDNSNELLNLIQNIVEIAQAETGDVSIQFIPSDLNNLIETLYTQFITKIKETGKTAVKIELDIPNIDYNQKFSTDPYRLKQIFTNLLDNALKFTEQGSITFGYTREGEFLRFFVRDTGLGIPADKLPLIFDKFYRLQGYENKLFRGSGIGLSLSRIMVEKLGGSLNVNSEVQKGSEFFFHLPMVDHTHNNL